MVRETFRIRQAIIIPLGIALLSLLFLLIVSFMATSLPGERFMLSVVTASLLYCCLEVFARRVAVHEGGVKLGKFLRKKELIWNEINHIGMVVMGAKVYILLTTTKGFFIISNNYGGFSTLVGKLIGHLDTERVDEDVRVIIGNPPKNNRPVYSSWCMVIVILAVAVVRCYIT